MFGKRQTNVTYNRPASNNKRTDSPIFFGEPECVLCIKKQWDGFRRFANSSVKSCSVSSPFACAVVTMEYSVALHFALFAVLLNSQFFRPTANGRIAFSARLLSIGTLPSPKMYRESAFHVVHSVPYLQSNLWICLDYIYLRTERVDTEDLTGTVQMIIDALDPRPFFLQE